jgi:hypothetical protein
MLVNKMKRPDKENYVVVSGKHAYKIQFGNINRRLQRAGFLQSEASTNSEARIAPLPVRPGNRNKQPLRVELGPKRIIN